MKRKWDEGITLPSGKLSALTNWYGSLRTNKLLSPEDKAAALNHIKVMNEKFKVGEPYPPIGA